MEKANIELTAEEKENLKKKEKEKEKKKMKKKKNKLNRKKRKAKEEGGEEYNEYEDSREEEEEEDNVQVKPLISSKSSSAHSTTLSPTPSTPSPTSAEAMHVLLSVAHFPIRRVVQLLGHANSDRSDVPNLVPIGKFDEFSVNNSSAKKDHLWHNNVKQVNVGTMHTAVVTGKKEKEKENEEGRGEENFRIESRQKSRTRRH